jgi:hypothetical protein
VATAAALYTPEVLALATSLAAFPLEGEFPLRGSARSPACGSTLELGLMLDGQGRMPARSVRPLRRSSPQLHLAGPETT